MSNAKIIILAIDGGGIRGIIPAYILNKIEQAVGKQSFELFDIIGGTSTGGILSVGLTSVNTPSNTGNPFTAAELLQLYNTQGSSIFNPQNCDIEYCATYWDDDGQGNGIEPFLQNTVGASTRLSDAHDAITALANARVKQMFTTGYIVNSAGNTVTNPVEGQDYGPYLFNWLDAIKTGSTDDYYLWEAARATSAAPVYFPVANVGGSTGKRSSMPSKWIVDGGMMSNNPAVWGYVEAFRQNMATQLSDIIIVSLGTGNYLGGNGAGIHTNYGGLTPDNGNWSEIPWIGLEPTADLEMYDLQGNQAEGTLINVTLSAVPLVADCQLNILAKAGLTYYRLEPVIPFDLAPMDNLANIQALNTCAEEYLSSAAGSELFAKVIKIWDPNYQG